MVEFFMIIITTSSEIKLMCRFVATEESYAHPTYKRKLVELDKTEYTNVFGRARWPNAPQRALVTPFFNDWKSLPPHENEVNQPVIGHATINGEVRSFILHFYKYIEIALSQTS